MKSAQEWYSEGGWNTDSNAIESIKEIQHDAWKQGMTDAAEIVNDARSGSEHDLHSVRSRIQTKRDGKITP